MMKVAIASDHAGFHLKEAIKEFYEDRFEFIDLGTESEDSVNYAEYGLKLGEYIHTGKAPFGIAICGSGIGISIAVNRYSGVRGALCTNSTMARLCREHNDANVLVLGSRIIGSEIALDCVDNFFKTEFEGGRHQTRIDTLTNFSEDMKKVS